jgi:hypothetical protein
MAHEGISQKIVIPLHVSIKIGTLEEIIKEVADGLGIKPEEVLENK